MFVRKATLIQADLAWEDKPTNLHNLEKLIQKSEKSEFYFLPELFNTGFSIKNPDLFEEMDGEGVQWLCNQSKKLGADISGSLLIKENEMRFNRLVWASNGKVKDYYDKRHLFRMGSEDKWINKGNKACIISSGGLNFYPQICYDLRFPVSHRNRIINDLFEYDVICFYANWPEPRIHAWRSLLIARSIENQCYTIGINRCGTDGNGNYYSGESLVVDPHGNIIAEAAKGMEVPLCFDLSPEILQSFRSDFQVSKDWDTFEIL